MEFMFIWPQKKICIIIDPNLKKVCFIIELSGQFIWIIYAMLH